MGEHWVHTGLLFDGRYDVARPEFLSYVLVDGSPRLVGVAYALPLLDGEEPPDGPAGPEAWHSHSRGLDDETLLPHHHHSGHGSQGPRLAMVHAWIWLPNPDGLFAADNWAIPFLRLGLEPPEGDAAAAGKALSLLSGGDRYVSRVVHAALAPGATHPQLESQIAATRACVKAALAERSGERLSPPQHAALGEMWRGLWLRLELLAPPEAVERMRAQAMR